MYVRTYVCVHVWATGSKQFLSITDSVCWHVFVYMHVHVCVYVCKSGSAYQIVIELA